MYPIHLTRGQEMKEFLQKALRLETILWVLLGLAILQILKDKYAPVDLSVFHYNEIEIKDLKIELNNNNIPIRL